MSYIDSTGLRIRKTITGMLFSRKTLRVLLIVIATLLFWQLIAMAFFEQRVLPSPIEVGTRLLDIMEDGGPRGNSALFHLQVSFVRVLIASGSALVIATILGVAMGINETVEDALTTILPFWMTFPTVIVVLVTMIMFDFSELSVTSAVIFAATPYATLNTYEGTKNVDHNLLEMAEAFKIGRTQVWRHIYLPNIMPYLFGTLRYIFGMCWKIAVLAEVFGMNEGLGSMFRFWYNNSDATALLAYLTLFMIVMFAIEYGVLAQLEKWTFRWRD